MKTILITGGAGFIGSHLCERLLNEGNKIICLDNFYTGRKDNIHHLLDSTYFEFIYHDIIKPIYLEVDQIYNLACPAAPIYYQYDPIKTMEINVIGILNILNMAKRIDATVLQASTSEVYGDPLVHPQNELYYGNVNPIGIRSCYDEGKRAAECIMMDYRRKKWVNTKIVRIFNTYGPCMAINDGRVISNFIVQALQDKDITVYGNGFQTRSFCYIDDLVDSLIMTMNTLDNFGGPINLGNPDEFTILELARLVIKLTNSNSKIIHLPLPEDDPTQRKPDITMAVNKFNWRPKVVLEEGLINTIKYFYDTLKKI